MFELYATGDNTLKISSSFGRLQIRQLQRQCSLNFLCPANAQNPFTMELSASTASYTKEATSQLFPRNFLMMFNK